MVPIAGRERSHQNCMFRPAKTCHFGQPLPLSAIDHCGSMNTLNTTPSRGMTWPIPMPIGTL